MPSKVNKICNKIVKKLYPSLLLSIFHLFCAPYIYISAECV